MNIHKRDHVWLVKWISSILMIIAMSMTSANVYPYNVFIGLCASIGWTYVGVMWKDRALIMLNAIAVGIYLIGTFNAVQI